MDQRSSTTATLRHSSFRQLCHSASATDRAALGLGSGPTLAVVPGHRLGRQATLAKGFRIMQPPAALPLFDMSVAVLDSLNLMRASVEEEVVLQSTLGVPAHHALACRLEAYGTPFSAPRLQDIKAGHLTEDDKQFAACLAAPPESDAIGAVTPEFSLQRMASLSALQRTPPLATREATQPATAPATPAAAARRGAGGELLRSPSVQPETNKKRAKGLHGGARQDSVGADNPFGFETPREDDTMADADAATPGASTPEGRAALAAAAAAAAATAAAAAAARPWQLFAGADDAVAALVGVGYLLMRAARFDRRTPRAVEHLSSELRRLSGGGAGRPGALGRAGSLAV
ncbi:MAG: hypothetical protein J3K34DRAFT_525846 [Monoraphidium minutum]|nr:MAG: hypothetical protein J3K34DRAFT_525846 [Monoraphidium minutum]